MKRNVQQHPAYVPVKPSAMVSIGANSIKSITSSNQGQEEESFEPRFAPTPLAKPEYLRTSLDSSQRQSRNSLMEHISMDSNPAFLSAAASYSSMLTADKDAKALAERSQLPGAHGITNDISKLQQQSLAHHAPGVIPGHVLGIETGPMMYTFPAQIIASQQRQIEMLQRQVEELKHLLVSMNPTCANVMLTNGIQQDVSTVKPVSADFLNGQEGDTTERISTLSNFNHRSSNNNNSNMSMTSTTTSKSDLLSFEPVPTYRSKLRAAVVSDESKRNKEPSKTMKLGPSVSDVDLSEDLVDIIENQYLPTIDDREEVLDRLIPNLHEVPMQTIIVSQQQPG